MKKTQTILLLLTLMFSLASCKSREAEIEIVNKLQNVTLRNISFGTILFENSLQYNDSQGRNVDDFLDNVTFPLKYQLQFEMSKEEKIRHLKTEEYFTLEEGQKLVIEIKYNTKVVEIKNE